MVPKLGEDKQFSERKPKIQNFLSSHIFSYVGHFNNIGKTLSLTHPHDIFPKKKTTLLSKKVANEGERPRY